MAINIIKRTSTHNTNYIGRRNITRIVIHYTAGVSSKTGSARNAAAWFANPACLDGSADFIVDDSEIVQYTPDVDTYLTWHCGDNRWNTPGGTFYGVCTNANSIGIEICCNNDNYDKDDPANSPKWYFTDAAVNKAIELTKYLMQKYGIDADHVIRHYDVSGKPCPGVRGWNTWGSTEEKWLAFKQKLGSATTTTTTTNTKTDTTSKTLYRVQCGAFSIKANADKLAAELKGKGYKDAFVVKGTTGISDIAYRVQCGAFSNKTNAENMKKKLQGAGYKDAFVVSSVVSSKNTGAKKTVAEIADEVIHGKWGNGQDRVNRLTAAGYDAAAVQRKVNELMSK